MSARLPPLALAALAVLLPPAGAAGTPPLDLEGVRREAADLPRLRSLLISRRGEPLFEAYFNGADRRRAANMKSASKSVISALVGIAIDRGHIESVREPIARFFPEHISEERNADKRSITVEDLLTMRSGLETTSGRNYGEWVLSDDWVASAIDRPLAAPPGARMLYSTGNTHLLSAIIRRASGADTRRFADEHLAVPLGRAIAHWPRDPQGVHFGGNDMEMTPRQMLAFGELYLNGGRHRGRQLVPEYWVAASFRPRARSPRGQGRWYGYGWWLRDLAGMRVPVAWGYGGQLIFVVRELELVVVATSDSAPGPGRRDHLRRLYGLVEERVLAPLAAAKSREGLSPGRPPASG